MNNPTNPLDALDDLAKDITIDDTLVTNFDTLDEIEDEPMEEEPVKEATKAPTTPTKDTKVVESTKERVKDPVSSKDSEEPEEPEEPEDSDETKDAIAVMYGSKQYVFPNIVRYAKESGTVTQTRRYQSKAKLSDTEPSLALTSLGINESATILDDVEEADVTASPKANWWYMGLGNSIFNYPQDSYLTDRLAVKGSDFKQGLDTPSGSLSIRGRRPSPGGNQTEGDAARLRILDAFSQTSRKEFLLPHSGFWITITRPSDIEINALYERINEERYSVARSTYGRSFVNTRSLILIHILDFIFENVHSVSVDLGNQPMQEFLYENILYMDLEALIWGVACLIWPDGWQYAKSIIGDPEDSHKVVRQRFDLHGIMHIDNTCFNEKQIRHWSLRRGRKHTMEDVLAYRNEFKQSLVLAIDPKAHGIEVRSDIRINITVPNLRDVVNTASSWIHSITKTWEDAAIGNDTARNRDRFIDAAINASRMRNYEHWVESISITVDDETTTYEHRETLAKVLEDLSSNIPLFDLIESSVSKYLVDRTVYVVGIPAVDKLYDEETLPNNPYILPLDTVASFFTMLKGRVASFAVQ